MGYTVIDPLSVMSTHLWLSSSRGFRMSSSRGRRQRNYWTASVPSTPKWWKTWSPSSCRSRRFSVCSRICSANAFQSGFGFHSGSARRGSPLHAESGAADRPTVRSAVRREALSQCKWGPFRLVHRQPDRAFRRERRGTRRIEQFLRFGPTGAKGPSGSFFERNRDYGIGDGGDHEFILSILPSAVVGGIHAESVFPLAQ